MTTANTPGIALLYQISQILGLEEAEAVVDEIDRLMDEEDVRKMIVQYIAAVHQSETDVGKRETTLAFSTFLMGYYYHKYGPGPLHQMLRN